MTEQEARAAALKHTVVKPQATSQYLNQTPRSLEQAIKDQRATERN